MNVLFLTSTLPRRPGDQQAPFVLEQAKAWRARRPEDKLFVLAPHDAGAARKETNDGIDIRRFRYMPWERGQTLAYPAILPNIRQNPHRVLQVPGFMAAEYAAARGLVRQEKIDLVYAHWIMPQGVVALALKRRLGVPYVLQNHSSDLAIFDRLGAPGRRLGRAVLGEAKAFFCVNSRQADFAGSLQPELDCHVLPMGVSMDVEAAVSTGSAETARYAIGSISRLSRKKGLHLLIAAAERLADRGRRVSIGIAGDGEEADKLAKQPEKADIRFTGFLTGPEKADFFGKCFAMAFPSVDDAGDVEGMPVALLEALVLGKPVIASRATNITLLPEWPMIRDDVTLLDDPEDTEAFAAALERVLDLPETEYAQRRERLQSLMGRYAWDRLIGEYIDVIERSMMQNVHTN